MQMPKQLGRWNATISSHPILPFISQRHTSICSIPTTVITSSIEPLKRASKEVPRTLVLCSARRRVRYEEDEDDGGGIGEWTNEEISMLELYSQSTRGEALIVHAVVDEQEVEVLIFRGFSSSLSYGTWPDPSRSILPARAVIKSIDRVKGPFDPSNIEYLEKGITWEAFRTRLPPI